MTENDDNDVQEPLLTQQQQEESPWQSAQGPQAVPDDLGGFTLRTAIQNLRSMGVMFLPLLLNLTAMYGVNVVSLAFVGHLGKRELAAASLGTSLVGICGRTVLFGMAGGLDTLASQSYGAGNLEAIGAHVRTAVAFLLLHLGPLAALLAAAPLLLAGEGHEGGGGGGSGHGVMGLLGWGPGAGAGQEEDLGAMAGRYVRWVLPSLLFECLNRPMNGALVAQRITAPQMAIQMVVLPLHIATNYVTIHVLKLGYLGAAVAYVATCAYGTVLMAGYIAVAGLAPRVWYGKARHRSLWRSLRSFARLSYPACFMRCAESWGFSLMTLAAGRLPDPGTSVAAVSVAFNLYGILYMCFAAFSVTACTQVGNALGAGGARAARHAALTSLCAAPLMWLAVAALLVEPHSQRALALIFTDGKDPALMYHLRRMLFLVAALELFDGSQIVMTGVIQGAGKQRLGVLVNLVAFYVFAIPLALLLAFPAHRGVEGMYMGMLAGPAIQTAAYAAIIARLDWRGEARRAALRHSASEASIVTQA